MKHKFLLFLVLIAGLFTTVSYSQNPSYPTFICTLANDTIKSPTVCKFDAYIVRTGTIPLQLYTYQLGFTYNIAALHGGTITAAWSNLDSSLVALGGGAKVPGTATPGVIKCASTAPSGGPTGGPFVSDVAPGMRYGTLTITCTQPARFDSLGLSWCFVTALYPTKVQAAINSLVTDITLNGTFTKSPNFGLPVELTSFVSNVNGRQVNLNWETKTEVNTRQFEIDRALVNATGSVTWTTVGSVQATGTSVTPKQYTYTEKNLQTGKYQYRLKIIDNDGSFEYSKVVETEVAVPKEFAISQNYPNPFNPTTKIDYQVPVDAKVIMEVYSITGQKVVELVNQDQQAGFYSVNFGASKLASGVYIYRIAATEKESGKNFSSIKKMMLLK
jgi:hypothetical protein